MLSKVKRLKNFKTIAQKFPSTKQWKLLGSGSFGAAYDLGDGTVCKITTSEREANIAKKLLKSKKNFRYIYKIINVFYIRSKKGSFRFGLIITPKYRKLTDRQKAELYDLFNVFEPTRSFKIRSLAQIRNIIRKELRGYYMFSGPPPEKLVRDKMKLVKKYNIYQILRSLKAAKLGPEDLHYENILKDKDRYILIDVAC